MSGEPIKKEDARVDAKRRRPSVFWLGVTLPVQALFIGVCARLSYEAFMWGWDLFGWV